jgi:hypothetical protein
MNPELSAAAIGLLLGAAKIGFVGTVGFAIAWARSRAKIRALEATIRQQTDDRLLHLEQMVNYIAGQLDQVAEQQTRQLADPRQE